MTLVLGVMCQDGVVIGADSAVTYTTSGGFQTVQLSTKKIWPIADNKMLFAASGDVGLAQRIQGEIEEFWKNLDSISSINYVRDSIERCAKRVLEPRFRTLEFIPQEMRGEALSSAMCYSLLAFIRDEQFHMLHLGVNATLTEFGLEMPFVSIGSGQPMADPLFGFLKNALWPSGRFYVSDAELVIAWILDTVIHINPGGVGGEKVIYRLTKDNSNLPIVLEVTNERIGETMQFIQDATEVLRKYKENHFGDVIIPKELLPSRS